MLIRHKLLKTQKNEVFAIIKGQGLDPANFSWDVGIYKIPSDANDLLALEPPEDTHEFPKLIYQNSQFYFQFELLDRKHKCEFSPGQETTVEEEFSGSWQLQKVCVRQWIHYLKIEIYAPDLWQEMEKYRTSVSIALPEQILNEPIPANEAEDISNKMSSLADKIEQKFKLTNEQNKFVRCKLNYLADASKRQRSMDWVHTAIGVFITIAMGLALAPDRAKELWQLFQSIFGGFIHLIGP